MTLMNKNIMIFVIVVLCFLLPILLAISESKKQGLNTAEHLLLAYARDVLYRSEETVQQVTEGVDRLVKGQTGPVCSDKQINIMRDIDLSSSYIQTIGHVLGNKLICSSVGLREFQWDLGPVEQVTSNGVKLRFNVQFPNSTHTYLVVEKDKYAAIIHKALPVNTALFNQEISLAGFMPESGDIYSSRGSIHLAWLKHLKDHQQVTFVQDDYLVALIKSKKFKIAALAAMPFSYLNQSTINTALFLVPVSGIVGLIVTYLLMYWARSRMSMTRALKDGLKRKEFFLVYQPIVNVQTRQCVGVEALMRWKHPSGEIIPPDIFIPLAENEGIINQLTQCVIDIVAKEAARIFELYPNFHIALNVSEADLHSEHVINLILALAKKMNIGPNNLIIEATERQLIDVDCVNHSLHKLRRKGIKIAIDDFGTGYSSLSYLESLEVDYLKIDQSFVSAAGTGAPAGHVMLHIIEMAKALKLKIIAEGIENEAQEALIRKYGVHFAQGWLYGKPTSFKNIIAMLDASAKPAVDDD